MSQNYKYPSKNPINKLEEMMEKNNFSKITIASYVFYISDLLKFVKKSPKEISTRDIIEYLESLVKKHKSRSTLNTAHSAFKFYFENILRRKFFAPHGKIARAKIQKSPPVILTEKEVKKIISATANLKHKLIFELMYRTGIKISEATNIKIGNMDIKNKTIKIKKRENKTMRDNSIERKVEIPADLMKKIDYYSTDKKNSDFLFPNNQKGKITERAIQKAFLSSLKNSNIYKPATCNSLRHSHAHNLLNAGMKITDIQKLMGYKLPEFAGKYKMKPKINKEIGMRNRIKNLIKLK